MQQNGHTIMQTDELTGGLMNKETGQADQQRVDRKCRQMKRQVKWVTDECRNGTDKLCSTTHAVSHFKCQQTGGYEQAAKYV